jgi:hypothetical protein
VCGGIVAATTLAPQTRSARAKNEGREEPDAQVCPEIRLIKLAAFNSVVAS